MASYLGLRSNEPGAVELAVVNGSTSTGYTKVRGASWGVFDTEGVFTGSIDSYGSVMVGASVAAREMVLPIMVSGSSQSDLVSKFSSLAQYVLSLHEHGGVLRFRPQSLDRIVEWGVESCRLVGDVWSPEAEMGSHVFVDLVLVVSPSGSASLDVFDDFSTNTLTTGGLYNTGGADWTKVTGDATATVASGLLTTDSTTGATYYTHTGTGFDRTDVRVVSKINMSTVANTKFAGVLLKLVGSDNQNMLRVQAQCDAVGGGNLLIRKVTAGTGATLATTAITTIAANTNYWIVGRVEGNVVHVEWWTTEPTPLGSPTHSTSAVMTSAEVALWGSSVADAQGVHFNTVGNGTVSFDDFMISGYTYRNVTLPDILPMNGAIPGDVPAKADITVTATGSSASAAPLWACFAWMPKPAPFNYVHNDGFETNTQGWVVTAVAGVVANAATSITRVTTAGAFYEGAAAGEVTCPATANSGTTFAIYRRFKRGVTYTCEAYVRSAAATTNLRLRLGVSGDIGSETATALSSTYTRRTTTWTPTADVDVAYFAAEITAATATVFHIDRVMVYEGTSVPAFVPGGEIPFGVINAAAADFTSTGSFFGTVPVADADYRSGFNVDGSGSMSTNGTLEWLLNGWPITPDDYARGEYQCKVFARVEIASTQADVNIVTSLRPDGGTNYGAVRYTQEWGTSGKTIAEPSAGTVFRWVNLGTIVMRVDRTRPMRYRLRMVCTNDSASTGTFGIDQICMIPARRSVMSITGVNDADFADFIASTSQTSKLIRWNKRCETSDPTSNVSRYPYPDGGLGGANILLPTGNVEVFAWLADYQPDRNDENAAGAGESVAATVSVSVKPQYVFART